MWYVDLHGCVYFGIILREQALFLLFKTGMFCLILIYSFSLKNSAQKPQKHIMENCHKEILHIEIFVQDNGQNKQPYFFFLFFIYDKLILNCLKWNLRPCLYGLGYPR